MGYAPGGRSLWLVLGEDNNKLIDLVGGKYKFRRRYNEVCGRGLEGLAVRWADESWQVAVLWEGGFFGRDCDNARQDFANPRVAIMTWRPSEGSAGPEREFELDAPVPAEGHRFRAPDLVWLGDGLLVLMSSTDARHRSSSILGCNPSTSTATRRAHRSSSKNAGVPTGRKELGGIGLDSRREPPGDGFRCQKRGAVFSPYSPIPTDGGTLAF